MASSITTQSSKLASWNNRNILLVQKNKCYGYLLKGALIHWLIRMIQEDSMMENNLKLGSDLMGKT